MLYISELLLDKWWKERASIQRQRILTEKRGETKL